MSVYTWYMIFFLFLILLQLSMPSFHHHSFFLIDRGCGKYHALASSSIVDKWEPSTTGKSHPGHGDSSSSYNKSIHASNAWNTSLQANKAEQQEEQSQEQNGIQLFSDEIITSIACGEGHSLVTTSEGEVYAFGRNNYGQCTHDHLPRTGRMDTKNHNDDNDNDKDTTIQVDYSCIPRKITSLDHECIVRVDASANTSFAITDTGKVYRWGLIHTHAADDVIPELEVSSVMDNDDDDYHYDTIIEDDGMRTHHHQDGATSALRQPDDNNDNNDNNEHTEVLGGRLVGMFDENNSNTSVPIDDAARQDQQIALASSSSSSSMSSTSSPSNTISTTTSSSDRQQQQQNRQISSIISDSASQWMLAGESDMYYAELRGMGYTKEDDEDREQNRGKEYHGMLKLGVKRISQPTPQLIKSPLLNKITIVSMAVGYSHFMLLSNCGRLFASGYNDRGQLGLGHRIGTAEIKEVDTLKDYFVSRVACGQQHTLCVAIPRSEYILNPFEEAGDVFAWGQGMLGQLGIGVRGTSKGRLIPTIIQDLKRYKYKRNLWITEIACGDNFSVAVSQCGVVYSWGHSEYNQHGQGSNASSDYTDPHYYYIPREITKISTILSSDEKVISVKCGAAFSVGITDKGNCMSWGWSAHGVLGRGRGFISSEPNMLYSFGKMAGEDRIVESFAVGTNHVVVSTQTERNTWAASKYSSFLESSTLEATADVELHLDVEQNNINNNINNNNNDDNDNNNNGKKTILLAHKVILMARSPYFHGLIQQAMKHQKLKDNHDNNNEMNDRVILDIVVPNVNTMKSLLMYMYTDRISMTSARSRHRYELANLATKLGVKNLSYLSDHINGLSTIRPASTFANDMLKCIRSKNHHFNDAYFYSKQAEIIDGYKTCIISAHKTILAHFMPYFDSLFNGGFLESFNNSDVDNDHNDRDDIIERTWVDLDPFIEDGITPSTFKKIVTVAYCGAINGCDNDDDDDDGDDNDKAQQYMEILIGANRFSFKTLADTYEKKLFACVKGCPENAVNLMEFARCYNFPKLEDKCKNCIRLMSIDPNLVKNLVHTTV